MKIWGSLFRNEYFLVNILNNGICKKFFSLLFNLLFIIVRVDIGCNCDFRYLKVNNYFFGFMSN